MKNSEDKEFDEADKVWKSLREKMNKLVDNYICQCADVEHHKGVDLSDEGIKFRFKDLVKYHTEG